MSRNAQGPRSTRGSSVTKADRRRLARLDRAIGLLDNRLSSVLLAFDARECARVERKRATLDKRRKELRLRMKETKAALAR
jgi:hypothetical protein